MKVALYHPWVYLRSGVERWMVEVVTRSRHDWTVYTSRHEPESTYPEVAGLSVVELAPRVSVQRSLGPLVHAAWTMGRLRLPDDGTQALLVSSEGLGDLVSLRSRVPTVAYCHTPLKILHDPAAADAVRRSSPARRAAVATLGPAFSAVDRAAWRRYAHVFVNSDETLSRVHSAGLRPGGPVEVLEPGVDRSWFSAGEPAAEPFFLCAGRIMWQKNLELAIDALRLLPEPPRLVIAGMVDVKSRPYLAALRERAAGLPVSFELSPPDGRLRELYASCAAFVFPARNEDFGIVVLEAMAAGAPVLAVDAGGPRSTVQHGVTGWLLPPTAQAFSAQLAQVLGASGAGGPGAVGVLSVERLAGMRVAARAAAETHGWDAHVARLDAVLDEVVER